MAQYTGYALRYSAAFLWMSDGIHITATLRHQIPVPSFQDNSLSSVRRQDVPSTFCSSEMA